MTRLTGIMLDKGGVAGEIYVKKWPCFLFL
jgi:hypothetical protein